MSAFVVILKTTFGIWAFSWGGEEGGDLFDPVKSIHSSTLESKTKSQLEKTARQTNQTSDLEPLH